MPGTSRVDPVADAESHAAAPAPPRTAACDPGLMPVTHLAQLKPGQRGRVRRVMGSGPIHRRILDMGVSKGVLIEVEREAPLHDPIKILVRGYALSLRKSEARLIEVFLLPD